MSIVVTGATGHLGRLTVESLLRRGVPAADIVATGRRTEQLKDLAERGVQVRTADFADPEALRTAFVGAERVLLVSGLAFGERVEQHRNVIEAAAAAGAGLVAYTSLVKADAATTLLAQDHQATEAILRENGVPFSLLRNGWYHENYLGQLPVVLEHGAVFGSAGEGVVNAASRADYADAAAAVLTGEGHENSVYELAGDEGYTLTELAAVIAAATGREIRYQDLPEADYTAALTAAGLPAPMPAVLADSDRGLRQGELASDSRDLSRLIGRPTTPLADAVAAAVAAL